MFCESLSLVFLIGEKLGAGNYMGWFLSAGYIVEYADVDLCKTPLFSKRNK